MWQAISAPPSQGDEPELRWTQPGPPGVGPKVTSNPDGSSNVYVHHIHGERSRPSKPQAPAPVQQAAMPQFMPYPMPIPMPPPPPPMYPPYPGMYPPSFGGQRPTVIVMNGDKENRRPNAGGKAPCGGGAGGGGACSKPKPAAAAAPKPAPQPAPQPQAAPPPAPRPPPQEEYYDDVEDQLPPQQGAPPPKKRKFSGASIASVIIFMLGTTFGIVAVTESFAAFETREKYADNIVPQDSHDYAEYHVDRTMALAAGCAATLCFTIATLTSFYSGMRHRNRVPGKPPHCCLGGFLVAGWIVFCLTFINDLIILVLAFDEENVIYPEVVITGLSGSIFAWMLMFGYSEIARRG